MASKPQVILADDAAFAANTEPAMVIITIDRDDIQTGNIAKILSRLHILTDSAENVRRYRESLAFQVDGYNNDRRQLPEIPEVRAYFRQLPAEWPHWMWFLMRNVGALALLLSLLCKVKIIRNGHGGSFGTQFDDMGEFESTIQSMLDRGIPLFNTFNISPAEAEESAESAINELFGHMT